MERRTYLSVVGAAVCSFAGCVTSTSSKEPDTEHSATKRPDTDTEMLRAKQTTSEATEQVDQVALDQDFQSIRSRAGDLLTDFEEAPDEWTEEVGTVSVDDTTSRSGTNSLELKVGDSVDQVTARYAFDQPQDFSQRSFSAAVKWETFTNQYAGLWLRLRDTDGDSLTLNQAVEWTTLDDWHRFDLGVKGVNGDPDTTDIVELDIAIWAGEGKSRAWIDDIRTTERTGEGSVILTFDDARSSVHSVAYPLMQEYGYRGAVGTIVHAVGKSGQLDQQQMDELASDGWDLCSHPQFGNRPLTEFDKAELTETLERYREWLLAHGFERGADCIIYPHGKINDAGLDVTANYHKLGFKVAGETPYGPLLTSPLLAGRVNGDEVQQTKSSIEQAAEYGMVVPIMYHRLGKHGGISKADFRATLEHIESTENVSVITPSEWLARHES